MKRRLRSKSGITLLETVITTGAIAVMGLVIFMVLNSGLILSAKNTALNVAHQQARMALLQMEQDLHSAISLPQLVDTSISPVSGQGPAAGVSFQVFNAGIGQCKIASNATANQTTISVSLNGATNVPKVGQRIIIPTHQIEQDITAVSRSGLTDTITIGSAIGVPIVTSSNGTNYNVMCFFTDRIAYVVDSGYLTYYGSTKTTSYAIMASDVTNTLPFSTPNTAAGAPYYRFVLAINISTGDPNYSNRNYKGANIILNGQVPMYARMTTYQ